MITKQSKDSSEVQNPEYTNVLKVVHSTSDSKIKQGYFKPKTRFLVKSGEYLLPISVEKVAYFCSYDKWTYLVTKEGKKFLVDFKLKELEEVLDGRCFFRLNRRFLVNIDSVARLVPYFKGQVSVQIIPEVNERVVVSRKRTPEFKAWITD